jgi:uncharacterized membrane-anchored protein YitT (DUF2179 family)
MKKNQFIAHLKDGVFIVAGGASAAFGLESLLLPNQFIDGGVTGISLLLANLTGMDLPVLIVLVNLPFLLLGRVVIGRQFVIKTAIAITLLALTLVFVHFPEVTEDKLLVSVFGGFFLGAGIGLSMRGGSVLDGTEVLAIFLSRRLGAKVSDWVILINMVIHIRVCIYPLLLDTIHIHRLTIILSILCLRLPLEKRRKRTVIVLKRRNPQQKFISANIQERNGPVKRYVVCVIFSLIHPYC